MHVLFMCVSRMNALMFVPVTVSLEDPLTKMPQNGDESIADLVRKETGFDAESFIDYWPEEESLDSALWSFFDQRIEECKDYNSLDYEQQFIVLGISAQMAKEYASRMDGAVVQELAENLAMDWIVQSLEMAQRREPRVQYSTVYQHATVSVARRQPPHIEELFEADTRRKDFTTVGLSDFVPAEPYLYHSTSITRFMDIINGVHYDFNCAFYLSFDLSQAKEWAHKFGNQGTIMVFDMSLIERLRILNLAEHPDACKRLFRFFRRRTPQKETPLERFGDSETINFRALYSYDAVVGPLLKEPKAFIAEKGYKPEGKQLAIINQYMASVSMDYFLFSLK